LDLRSQVSALDYPRNYGWFGFEQRAHPFRCFLFIFVWPLLDRRKVEPYKGDIQAFKMDMRSQMDLHGEQKGSLRGDASEAIKEETEKEKAAMAAKKAAAKEAAKKKESSISVAPSITKTSPEKKKAESSFAMESLKKATPDVDATPVAAPAAASGGGYVPPHLRNKESGNGGAAPSSSANVGGRYVPPHLRK
jgi:hypothetical protein